jgi:hypothetical protein
MMRVSEVIAALQRELAEHGDVEVHTGGPEGDEISGVGYWDEVNLVYIG